MICLRTVLVRPRVSLHGACEGAGTPAYVMHLESKNKAVGHGLSTLSQHASPPQAILQGDDERARPAAHHLRDGLSSPRVVSQTSRLTLGLQQDVIVTSCMARMAIKIFAMCDSACQPGQHLFSDVEDTIGSASGHVGHCFVCESAHAVENQPAFEPCQTLAMLHVGCKRISSSISLRPWMSGHPCNGHPVPAVLSLEPEDGGC